MIDDRESQRIRLRNPEKAETENTEVVPVSDKAGRRGDGDPDDQNDHQNEGGRNRQVEAEGQKEQIDCDHVDEPDYDRQQGGGEQKRRVDHDPEPFDEMVDQPVHGPGIAHRKPSNERGQDAERRLAPDNHPNHHRKQAERHKQEQHAGTDKPRRQRGEKKGEHGDDEDREAVEHPFHENCAERRTHGDAALFRDEVGPGQLSQARRDGDDGQKSDAAYGEEGELIDLSDRSQDEPPADRPQKLHQKHGRNGGEDVAETDRPEAVDHPPELNPADREPDQQGAERQARNHLFLHQPSSVPGSAECRRHYPAPVYLLTRLSAILSWMSWEESLFPIRPTRMETVVTFFAL